MTTGLSTIGVFFDSIDVQHSDLGIYLSIVRGLDEPPKVRGTDSIVPALAGRAEGLRINDVLVIELAGVVQADGGLDDGQDQRESFRTNQRLVRALFAPDRERAELLVVLEDGTTSLTIQARPMNAVWKTIVESLVKTVSIELEGYGDWTEV